MALFQWLFRTDAGVADDGAKVNSVGSEPTADVPPSELEQFNQFAFAIHFELGIQHISSGQLRESLSCVEDALKLIPESGGAWLLRAEVCSKLNLRDEALVSFERAIQFHSTPLTCWIRKGLCHLRYFQSDEAAACFRQAISLKADAALHWRLLGTALTYSDRQSAIKSFERALELDPGDVQSWASLGDILFRDGNHSTFLQKR